ncbi:hypothetical protein B6E66_30775 [Streptomyces maremycinicus]|nr:hypothetical protein B6E66_30775 [Streptomyces sp. B9173]
MRGKFCLYVSSLSQVTVAFAVTVAFLAIFLNVTEYELLFPASELSVFDSAPALIVTESGEDPSLQSSTVPLTVTGPMVTACA